MKPEEIVERESAAIARELDNEAKLNIALEVTDSPAAVIDAETQKQLIRALRCCPNGVARMSQALEGIVDTSNNLARVASDENTIKIQCLVRSLSDSARDQHALNVAAAFELAGAQVSIANAYPGWTPNMQSPLLALMQETYKNMTGEMPEVKIIPPASNAACSAKPIPTGIWSPSAPPSAARTRRMSGCIFRVWGIFGSIF